ncbi:MAG: acetyl-CoA carboxylase, carboxyltransferase subunit beta [Candidatus Marinimicrobia bacterium]|nr:acetyl-CoA carboxylase, carboxyltransferase subunit beta [Candidatus Neomarinimicrobiota bacterium]
MSAWFRRKKKKVSSQQKKKDVPEGLWIKCRKCSEILYKKELKKNKGVCPNCRYHFRIPADDYIDILLDNYTEFNQNIKSADPLKFQAQKKYKDQLKKYQKKTNQKSAVKTVVGEMDGYDIVLCVMDFRFIGGSMGSALGEKIARAIDRARKENLPLIIVSSSGGARMMEGILSLMQMAKTSAKLAQFDKTGGLYISIMADPTTGGTTASYAMLGDINIAEPGALIGFAGPRVIKQTINKDLPEGFQRSNFIKEKGFADMIVGREEMKQTLIDILDFFYGSK